MLEGLARIPWGELKHASGDASDVPDLIRALAGPTKKRRDAALTKLTGNIFHQGTRYQATAYAVPFIYELLSSAQTPDRDQLIDLVLSLALGCEEAYLLGGFDVETFYLQLDAWEQDMDDEERADCEAFGHSPAADRSAYCAVRDGVAHLVAAATDGLPQVRRAALHALAWFPEAELQSLPVLQERADCDEDLAARATALIALGMLGGQAEAGPIRDAAGDERLVIRAAAGVALCALHDGEPPEEALDLLLEALLDHELFAETAGAIPWNQGDFSGLICLMLSRADCSPRLVTALCGALEQVEHQASLGVTASLLRLVLRGRGEPIVQSTLGSLSELERQALRAIALHGGWQVGGRLFESYRDLIESHGVHRTQKKLRRFLRC